MKTRHAVVAALFLSSTAYAIKAREPQLTNVELDLQVTPARTIEATVIGGPNLNADRYTLTDAAANVTIAASDKKTFTQGNQPIAIAIVFNGGEIWVGNDDIEPADDPSRYVGALKGWKHAMTAMPLGAIGPAGSEGEVITFATGAQRMVPMGPLAKLTADSFGTQKDYYRKLGTDLVTGLELAMTDLHESRLPRKALIVVSDGNDTNNEAAAQRLALLKKQAAQDRIETFAIIYKGQLSDPENVITKMIPKAVTVNTADDFSIALQNIYTRVADRFYLTFPGDKLAWDGKVHELTLRIDGNPLDPVSIELSQLPSGVGTPAPQAVQKRGCGGCASGGDAGMLVAIVGVGLVKRRRR